MSTKAVFLRFVCLPGLKNDPQNWPTHTSVHQFSAFSLFQPKCDFEQPSHDLAAFIGFVCHFFSVGAVQDPIKQTPVAAAVPSHIFNMLLQKILPKMTPKRVSFSSGLRQFGMIFKHRTLFASFLPKWRQRHQKGHLNDTLFGPFVWKLAQSPRKGRLNDPPELPEWHIHGSILQ